MSQRAGQSDDLRKAPYQSVSSKYGIDSEGKGSGLESLSQVKSPYQTMSLDLDDNVLQRHEPASVQGTDTVKVSRLNSSKFYIKSATRANDETMYANRGKKLVNDVPVLDASGKLLPLVGDSEEYRGNSFVGSTSNRQFSSPDKLRFGTSQTYNVLTEQSRSMNRAGAGGLKHGGFQANVHVIKEDNVAIVESPVDSDESVASDSAVARKPVERKKTKSRKPEKKAAVLNSATEFSLELPSSLDKATVPLTATYIQTFHRVPVDSDINILYDDYYYGDDDGELNKLPRLTTDRQAEYIAEAQKVLDDVQVHLAAEDAAVGQLVARKALQNQAQLHAGKWAPAPPVPSRALHQTSLSASLAEGWLVRLAAHFGPYVSVPRGSGQKQLDLLGLGGVDSVFPQAFSTLFAATAGLLGRFHDSAKHSSAHALIVRVLIDTYVALLNNQDPEMTEWTYCCFHLHMQKKSHILLSASAHQLVHMLRENSGKYRLLTSKLRDLWAHTHRLALTRAKVVSLAHQTASLNATGDTLEPHLTVARAASSSWRSQERLTASDEASMTRTLKQVKSKYQSAIVHLKEALHNRSQHIQMHEQLRRDIQNADRVSRDLEVRIGMQHVVQQQLAQEEENMKKEQFLWMKDEELKKKKILLDSINLVEHINTKQIHVCGEFITDKKFIGSMLLQPQKRTKLLKIALGNTIHVQQKAKTVDNSSISNGSNKASSSTTSNNNNNSNSNTTNALEDSSHNAHFTLDRSVQKLEAKIHHVVTYQKKSLQQINNLQREISETLLMKDQIQVQTLQVETQSGELRSTVDMQQEEGKAIESVMQAQQTLMRGVVGQRKRLERNIQNAEQVELRNANTKLEQHSVKLSEQKGQLQEEEQSIVTAEERVLRLKEETEFQAKMYATALDQIESLRVRNEYLNQTGVVENSMLELVNTYKLREGQFQHEVQDYNRLCEQQEFEREKIKAHKTAVQQQIDVTRKYVDKVVEISATVDTQLHNAEQERTRRRADVAESEMKLLGQQEKHNQTHQAFLTRRLALQEESEVLQRSIVNKRNISQTLRKELKTIHNQVRDSTIRNRQQLQVSSAAVERLRVDLFGTKKSVITLYDKAKSTYITANDLFQKRHAELLEIEPQFERLRLEARTMVEERREYLRVKQGLVAQTQRDAALLARVRLLKKLVQGMGASLEIENGQQQLELDRKSNQVTLNMGVISRLLLTRADNAYHACQRVLFAKRSTSVQATAATNSISIQTDPLATMDIRGKRVELKKKIVAMSFDLNASESNNSMGSGGGSNNAKLGPPKTPSSKTKEALQNSTNTSECSYVDFPTVIQWLALNNSGDDLAVDVHVGETGPITVTVPYTCYGSPVQFVQASVTSALQSVFSSPLQRLEKVMNGVETIGEEALQLEEQVILRAGLCFDHLLQLSNNAVLRAAKIRKLELPEELVCTQSALTESVLNAALEQRRTRVIPEGYTAVHTGWNTFDRQAQILQAQAEDEQLYFQYILQHSSMDMIEDLYIYTMLAKHAVGLFGGSSNNKHVSAALAFIHYILDLYQQIKRDRQRKLEGDSLSDEEEEDVSDEEAPVYGVDGQEGELEQPKHTEARFNVHMLSPLADIYGKGGRVRTSMRSFVRNWSQSSLSSAASSSSGRQPSGNVHQLLELYNSPAFKNENNVGTMLEKLPSRRRSRRTKNGSSKEKNTENNRAMGDLDRYGGDILSSLDYPNHTEYAYEYKPENNTAWDVNEDNLGLNHHIKPMLLSTIDGTHQNTDGRTTTTTTTTTTTSNDEEHGLPPDYQRAVSLTDQPIPQMENLRDSHLEDGDLFRDSWVVNEVDDNMQWLDDRNPDIISDHAAAHIHTSKPQGYANEFGKNLKAMLASVQQPYEAPTSPVHLSSASSYGNILKRLILEQRQQQQQALQAGNHLEVTNNVDNDVNADVKQDIDVPNEQSLHVHHPSASQQRDRRAPAPKLSFQDQYIIVGNRLIKKSGNEDILRFLQTQTSILETQVDLRVEEVRPSSQQQSQTQQTLKTGQVAFSDVDSVQVPVKHDNIKDRFKTQRVPFTAAQTAGPTTTTTTSMTKYKLPPLHVLSQPRGKDDVNTVRAVKTAVQRSVRNKP